MLPFKHGGQVTSTLKPLIKRLQRLRSEAPVLVVGIGLDAVVEDADFLVGVARGNVESEVVMKGVVGIEFESGEGGVGNVEVEHVYGTEYEPEDECRKAYNDDNGGYELEKEAQDTTAAAAFLFLFLCHDGIITQIK